jgi:hypothetical protein
MAALSDNGDPILANLLTIARQLAESEADLPIPLGR